MATVFLATDVRHHRKVALKVLRPDLAAALGPERFLQEVRVTANLQHPHILPLFDSGEAEGFLYYVMPYLEGESLRERITHEGELPIADTVRILIDTVDALAAAHAVGVVHRDIKPDNILLSGRHATVTDFGVAKAVSDAAVGSTRTTAGMAVGTPAYMAPEQAAADEHVDHRADIYAVGVLGYELLTDQLPFAGHSARRVLSAQMTEIPREICELRPTVPPGLGTVLMRCLQKKPADRWQTAEELLGQLEALATESGSRLTPGETRLTGRTRKARLPLWVPPLAALALAVWVAHDTWTADRAARESAAAGDERERLVVLPFEVLGRGSTEDDDTWAELAADWVARAIDEPRPVDVVPAADVHDAVHGLAPGAGATTVAGRLGARYALAGTLAHTGGEVRFEAGFFDTETGERLRSVEPATGPADSMEAVVGRLADAAAGLAVILFDPEAPPWLGGYRPPPSLEAYRDYEEQSDAFCRGRFADAIALGDQVIARAPTFVPAISWNAAAYENLGLWAKGDSVLRFHLEPLRDRMTTLERLDERLQRGWLGGDPDLATSAAEEGIRISRTTQWVYLAEYQALRTRRLSDALEDLALYDPDAPCALQWKPWWTVSATVYHLVGDYDAELKVARRGLERFPNYRALLGHEADAFAALGRVGAVDSLLDVMDSLPPASGFDPDLQTIWAGLELRAHDHPGPAQRAFDRALAGFAARGPAANRYDRAQALWYARRWSDADTAFAGLLDADPDNLAYEGFHGTALAGLGRREQAAAVSDQLAGLDTPYLQGTNTAWRAEIAALLGDREGAVRLLQNAFAHGYPFGLNPHRTPAFEGMRGYPPWEVLLRPGHG